MACGISSFNGKINEISGICIDNFNILEYRAYFLSHCHSDHTEGLFSRPFYEYVTRNNINIYMSSITADLVIMGCKDLKNRITVLKIGTTHITLAKQLGFEEQHLTISVIPAGHCFGSVMFLFQTNLNSILYTGDFRIAENDVSKLGPLHDKYGKPLNLDAMYVDTTFIDKKYISFPKRSTCVEELIDIIKSWLEEDTINAVALNMPAKIGYEYLYNAIYRELKLKVYVNMERYKFYRKYTDIVGITNNEDDANIHVCNNFRECKNHDSCINKYRDKKFLLIRLTAMKWANYDMEESPIQRHSIDKVYACFPTHCSRSELIYFINYFNPTRVYGFPNEYKENKLELNQIKDIKCDVKKAVKRKGNSDNKSNQIKVPANVLQEMFEI